MKIKLTLAQLIKLRDKIIDELKSNQKALIKINSVKEHNKEFNRKLLIELERIQKALREDLVKIKMYILGANFEVYDMTHHMRIFKLSELKEELKCYQGMKTKNGTFKENGKEVKYVTILSKSNLDTKIKSIKEEIKEHEDILLINNNNTIVDIDLNHIETFNIASKLQ